MEEPGYFELQPYYEGKKLKIYKIEQSILEGVFPVEEVDEAIQKLTVRAVRTKGLAQMYFKKKGYRLCDDLSHGVVPNKKVIVGYTSYYVYDPGAKPLPVQFIETTVGTNYIRLRAGDFYKVSRVPMIFSLVTKEWVVDGELCYSSSYKKDRLLLSLDISELAEYEQFGLNPVGAYTGIYEVKGSIPTGVYLKKGMHGAGVYCAEISDLYHQSIDLEVSSRNLQYVKDEEGCYWEIGESEMVFSKEEVNKRWPQLECEEVKLNLLSEYSRVMKIPLGEVSIPLREVSAVRARKCHISVRNDGVLALEVGFINENIKRATCSLGELYLTRPWIYRPWQLALINSDTDPISAGFVKLTGGKTCDPAKKLRVFQIKEGMVVQFTGTFALPGDVRIAKRKPPSPRTNKKELQELQLQHELVGPRDYWTKKDLLEYDALMRSGEYADTPFVRFGNRLIEMSSTDVPSLINWTVKEFISKKSRVKVTLWRILGWQELLNLIKKQVPQRAFSTTERKMFTIVMLASLLDMDTTVLTEIFAEMFEVGQIDLVNELAKLQQQQE